MDLHVPMREPPEEPSDMLTFLTKFYKSVGRAFGKSMPVFAEWENHIHVWAKTFEKIGHVDIPSFPAIDYSKPVFEGRHRFDPILKKSQTHAHRRPYRR